MIIPITELNPKIQCQYVLLKAGKYFLWISYETYSFTIFSKRNHKYFFFLNENKNKKLKKKEKSYLQFVSPTLI